jgi:hypothetical protein
VGCTHPRGGRGYRNARASRFVVVSRFLRTPDLSTGQGVALDFQFQLLVWLVVLIIAVLVGGPVLALVGMFVAWLLPFLILGGLVLLALAVIGRSIDKH